MERTNGYVSGLFFEVGRSEGHTYGSLEAGKSGRVSNRPTTKKTQKEKSKGSIPTESKGSVSDVKDYEKVSNITSGKENLYQGLGNCKEFKFDVTGYPSMDNNRFGIVTMYVLCVNEVSIDLLDPLSSKILFSWKLRHIRKFGFNKGRKLFFLITGRRCHTANSTICFEVHSNYDSLLTVIDTVTHGIISAAQSTRGNLFESKSTCVIL